MAGKRILSTLFAVSVFLVAPYMVQAQDHLQGPESATDPFAIYQATGINSDQLNQIHLLVHDFDATQKPRIVRLLSLYKEMDKLRLQADADGKAVMEMQGQINSTTAEVANEKMRIMLKVREVLTLDQRKKLVNILRSEQQQHIEAAKQAQTE